MKRRTFIKGLVAGILSPFIARGTATPEKTRSAADIAFAEKNVIYPDHPMSHVNDALRYGLIPIDDDDWLRGDRWPQSEIRRMAKRQAKINRARSLILNKITCGRVEVKLPIIESKIRSGKVRFRPPGCY